MCVLSVFLQSVCVKNNDFLLFFSIFVNLCSVFTFFITFISRISKQTPKKSSWSFFVSRMKHNPKHLWSKKREKIHSKFLFSESALENMAEVLHARKRFLKFDKLFSQGKKKKCFLSNSKKPRKQKLWVDTIFSVKHNNMQSTGNMQKLLNFFNPVRFFDSIHDSAEKSRQRRLGYIKWFY